MKITTMNLRHGGSTRIKAIADHLLSDIADITVCTEFRCNKYGKYLQERFEARGFSAHFPMRLEPQINSVVVFAPRRSEPIYLSVAPSDQPRVAAVSLDSITVVGVYFAQNKAKASLFSYFLSEPPVKTETVIIGDFNTGRHRVDELGKTFHCANEFSTLGTVGYTDLWRMAHGPDAREYSWFSPRGGPFRIDHAFGTNEVARWLRSCKYDHDIRGTLSDHSQLTLELTVST